MDTHKENGRQTHDQVTLKNSNRGEGHDPNLQKLYAYGDGSFAEAVGEITSGHGEQDERQGQQCVGQRDERLLQCRGSGHIEADENDKSLEGIVIESTLELRDD